MYIKMKLFGKEIPCLLDSGCDTTMVPKKLTDRFRRIVVMPSAQSILAANDTPIRVNGESRLPFVLQDRCIRTRALVSEDIEDIDIVGCGLAGSA